MVEIPDRLIARHAIAEALEWAEEIDVPTTYALGEFGQYETELDWTLNDLNPDECDVDMVNDSTLLVSGGVEAKYTVQVSSGSRWHPPEYRTEYVPLWIGVELDLSNEGAPRIIGEIH
jgi:hypothetical protein